MFHLLSPDELTQFFTLTCMSKEAVPTVSTMKGYRVKVKYDGQSNSDSKAIIERIVRGGK